MVNEHTEVFAAPSVAVYWMECTPTGKVLPDADPMV